MKGQGHMEQEVQEAEASELFIATHPISLQGLVITFNILYYIT